MAGVRPQLVEVPKGLLSSGQFDHEGPGKIIWTLDETFAVLVVPVRNVGPGVAYIRMTAILNGQGPIHSPETTSSAIAPGDTASVISLATQGDNWYAALARQHAQKVVQVGVLYADVNGSQRTFTRLTVARAADVALVRVVELFHCDEKWDPGRVVLI